MLAQDYRMESQERENAPSGTSEPHPDKSYAATNLGPQQQIFNQSPTHPNGDSFAFYPYMASAFMASIASMNDHPFHVTSKCISKKIALIVKNEDIEPV